MIPQELISEVIEEHEFAISNFPPFRSPHEGYAIILEEVEELKGEIFKHQKIRDVIKMRKEALQVATMAIRFIIDICDKKDK